MLNYFHLIEKTRCWPAHSQRLLYFLLLKESGKDRPIGLISTMARWWEHLREPEVSNGSGIAPRLGTGPEQAVEPKQQPGRRW